MPVDYNQLTIVMQIPLLFHYVGGHFYFLPIGHYHFLVTGIFRLLYFIMAYKKCFFEMQTCGSKYNLEPA